MQHYVIKFVSDLRQIGGFLCVLRFPPPINWPPWYDYIIVESGVKHHNPKPNLIYDWQVGTFKIVSETVDPNYLSNNANHVYEVLYRDS
jgi:hypothetical protein